jgi:hypothetical protein
VKCLNWGLWLGHEKTGFKGADRLFRPFIPACDSLLNRHATKHAHATSHPVIASAEPGERWLYCYLDDMVAEYQSFFRTRSVMRPGESDPH